MFAVVGEINDIFRVTVEFAIEDFVVWLMFCSSSLDRDHHWISSTEDGWIVVHWLVRMEMYQREMLRRRTQTSPSDTGPMRWTSICSSTDKWFLSCRWWFPRIHLLTPLQHQVAWSVSESTIRFTVRSILMVRFFSLLMIYSVASAVALWTVRRPWSYPTAISNISSCRGRPISPKLNTSSCKGRPLLNHRTR